MVRQPIVRNEEDFIVDPELYADDTLLEDEVVDDNNNMIDDRVEEQLDNNVVLSDREAQEFLSQQRPMSSGPPARSVPIPSPPVPSLRADTQPQYKNNSELLENSLSQEVEQDSNVKSVAKELFNNSAIDLKTEVSHNEIVHLTKIRFLKEAFGISHTDSLLVSFLSLRVSKDRRSRSEFIESLQTERRNNNGGSFMQRMFGGGNGGSQNP